MDILQKKKGVVMMIVNVWKKNNKGKRKGDFVRENKIRGPEYIGRDWEIIAFCVGGLTCLLELTLSLKES